MTRRDASRRRRPAAAVLAVALGLLVALLLAALPPAFDGAPAQAYAVSGATYGAGANTTGNPIGGGPGYSHYYSPAGAIVVTTQSGLTDALSAATSGDVIWIPDGATITITSGYGKTLKSGVTLASNRGQGGAAGGKIKWTYTSGSGMTALLMLQSNTTISGLTLEGPIATASMDGGRGASCIGLRGVDGASSIEVENCEISKFPWAGMYFNGGNLTQSTRHHIHHCYIHNCQRHGLGYGIAEEGSCAYLAEGNIFRENRHHIMAQAGSTNPNSYEVRYNQFYEAKYANNGNVNGTWYYSHQVDCHGCSSSSGCYAGNVLNIHHNTFYENPGKPNVCIRGIPKTLCEVSYNWTTKKGTDAGQGPDSAAWSQWVGSSSYQRMSVHNNWYGGAAPADEGAPAVTITGGSTQSNRPPAVPSRPAGTTSGTATRSYMYRASTADPNGDRVSYTFSWSDGNTTSTGLMASGATAYVSHRWAKAGAYGVYVRATDARGASSSWSARLDVTVAPVLQTSLAGGAPATPSRPTGAALAESTVAGQYSAVTSDPDGDALEYVFEWGDGTTSSVTGVQSGAVASLEHAWDVPGTYTVTASAIDPEGAVSEPSAGLTVTVAGPGEAPPPEAPATAPLPEAPAPAPPEAPAPAQPSALPAPPDASGASPAAPEAAAPDEGSSAPAMDEGPGDKGLPAPEESAAGPGGWSVAFVAAAAVAAVLLAGAVALRWKQRRQPPAPPPMTRG